MATKKPTGMKRIAQHTGAMLDVWTDALKRHVDVLAKYPGQDMIEDGKQITKAVYSAAYEAFKKVLD